MKTRARKLPAGFWKGAGSGKAPRRVRRVQPKTLTKVVKSIVRRQEETKTSGEQLENGIQHNARITNADIVPVLSQMNTGTTIGTRIGDAISPVSLVVTGSTSINDQGGYIGVPVTVKVMILQAKGIRDTNLLAANADIPNLLESGSGTTGWDGSTMNSLYKVNFEKFTVLGSRTFKLGDATAENTRSMTKRWSIRVKCPSVLRYSPATQYPSNFAPFMVVGWSRDDGVTPGLTDLWIVNTANAVLSYKDV